MLRGAALAAAVLIAGPALAYDNYTFTASVMGGRGARPDTRGEDPFEASALQLSVGMLTQDRTFAVLRAGRLEYGNDHEISGRLGPKIEYVNVAGEYRFREPAYDFGLFLGLGAYRVNGEPIGGINREEQALGFALGVTGDFDLSRHVSIVAEIDVHYPLFDEPDLYGVALGGVAVHF